MANKKTRSFKGLNPEYSINWFFVYYRARTKRSFCPCNQFKGQTGSCSSAFDFGEKVIRHTYREWGSNKSWHKGVYVYYWKPEHFIEVLKEGYANITGADYITRDQMTFRPLLEMFYEKERNFEKKGPFVPPVTGSKGGNKLAGVDDPAARKNKIAQYYVLKKRFLDVPITMQNKPEKLYARAQRIVSQVEAIESWLATHGGIPWSPDPDLKPKTVHQVAELLKKANTPKQ